jgi:mRNA-degrading endonuclease toxin of MazEF toxin-antitoxin module
VKVRPALVVQSDHNNVRLTHTIVAIITKTTHRATSEATQLLIDISTPEGKQSGLLHTSAVKGTETPDTQLLRPRPRRVAERAPILGTGHDKSDSKVRVLYLPHRLYS